MKQFLDHYVSPFATALIAIILVLVPFHALLTVSAASVVGHYTALRLWEELLLIPLTLAALYVVWQDANLRKSLYGSWLWRLAALFIFVQLAWGLVSLLEGGVNAKAGAYGLLVNIRYLLFFWIVWVIAAKNNWLHSVWPKLVLIPAAIVAVFGLLQRFALPHDFLKHFGYNDQTISPFETIDHKVQYLRIQSTLRGANFLGAYMIIVLSVIATLLRGWRLFISLAVGLIILFISGSRGAWVGAGVALLCLLALSLRGRRTKLIAAGVSLALVLVAGGGVWVLRDNDFVQNSVFHTDEKSRSQESSNAAHFTASYAALKQVAREPLGRGPGTAGPASVYNSEQPSRIAENYFLQIAQETGWLGLGLFVGVYLLTGIELWHRRAEVLPRALLAALLGITCMALLMHVWVDETVAFLFWGLTGLALSIKSPREKS